MRADSRVRQLETLPRLLAAAAAQTARLFNASDLAAPFAASRPTIRDYVTLLEQVFLLEQQFLETFVLQELRRQASWQDYRLSFHHFRDKDGVEVDIVIERGAAGVAGIDRLYGVPLRVLFEGGE